MCLRGGLQRTSRLRVLVGDGAQLAAGGVPAAGVVAGDAGEHRPAGPRRGCPSRVRREGLPLEGGVEGLGEGVVGAGPDSAHRAGRAQADAQVGVGPEVYWADSSGRRNTPISRGVTLGRTAAWMSTKTGRAPMRSPGRPPPRRDVERAFWGRIAEGTSSEDAAVAVGVSGPVASRWFRQRGSMSAALRCRPSSGRYLLFTEREEIALLRAQGAGVRQIARRIGRAASTVLRDLRRKRGHAGWATGVGRRSRSGRPKGPPAGPRPPNWSPDRLRDYVQDRLAARSVLFHRPTTKANSHGATPRRLPSPRQFRAPTEPGAGQLSLRTRSTVRPRAANQATALRSTPVAVAAVSSLWISALAMRLWSSSTVVVRQILWQGSLLAGLTWQGVLLHPVPRDAPLGHGVARHVVPAGPPASVVEEHP